MRQKLISILSILMLLLSSCLSLSMMSFATPGRASICIDPPSIRASVNATFSININISEITNLLSYELMLKYDNELLNCTHAGMPPGHFLDSNNTYIVKDGEIHQNESYVFFVAALLRPEKPRNGSGVLGTITFRVLGKGECPLEIYDIILLGDEEVIPPEQYDVNHGYFVASFYGDLNGDGIVNILDIAIVALAYHSKPGDPNWNPIADLAEPYNWVNIIDVAAVAKKIGKED